MLFDVHARRRRARASRSRRATSGSCARGDPRPLEPVLEHNRLDLRVAGGGHGARRRGWRSDGADALPRAARGAGARPRLRARRLTSIAREACYRRAATIGPRTSTCARRRSYRLGAALPARAAASTRRPTCWRRAARADRAAAVRRAGDCRRAAAVRRRGARDPSRAPRARSRRGARAARCSRSTKRSAAGRAPTACRAPAGAARSEDRQKRRRSALLELSGLRLTPDAAADA